MKMIREGQRKSENIVLIFVVCSFVATFKEMIITCIEYI